MSNAKEALKELRVEQKTLSKKIQGLAAEVFTKGSSELFTNNPDLKSFSWTQYTPFFNDGDVCKFSAHTDDPKIQFRDEEEREYFYLSDTEPVKTGNKVESTWRKGTFDDEYKYVPKINSDYDLAKNAVYVVVKNFLSEFTKNDLKFMFGEGEVVVTPSGADTEEYDHE